MLDVIGRGSKERAFGDAAGLLPCVDRRLDPLEWGMYLTLPRTSAITQRSSRQLDRIDTVREQLASACLLDRR